MFTNFISEFNYVNVTDFTSQRELNSTISEVLTSLKS